MDPAVQRILTVDKRARDEVRKAEEYADGVRASLAEEEQALRREAELEVQRRIDELRREEDERTDRLIEDMKRAVQTRICPTADADKIESLARLAVSKITETAR